MDACTRRELPASARVLGGLGYFEASEVRAVPVTDVSSLNRDDASRAGSRRRLSAGLTSLSRRAALALANKLP